MSTNKQQGLSPASKLRLQSWSSSIADACGGSTHPSQGRSSSLSTFVAYIEHAMRKALVSATLLQQSNVLCQLRNYLLRTYFSLTPPFLLECGCYYQKTSILNKPFLADFGYQTTQTTSFLYIFLFLLRTYAPLLSFLKITIQESSVVSVVFRSLRSF